MRKFSNRYRALFCTSALSLALVPGTAFAQEEGATEGAPIVVTGSRILRRDYEAASPIVTVGEELLNSTGSSSLEVSLNKLPAFTPVQTPAAGGDIQATARNTPGAATVSLRGLGTNRNLVLIDGRRAVPANALGVVDINTIPAAAVERVEIITGGASATYGADAVGGVVNFILKDDFEGLELDAQSGITSRGDGFQYTLSGLMGTNFDDGRGNITIGLSMNQRNSAAQEERKWFRDVWQDPSFVGTEFFPAFSGYQPTAGLSLPSQASYDALFGVGAVAAGSRLYFNADGTAFTGFFQSPPGGAFRFNGDTTGYKWKVLADGSLGQNFTDAYAQLPLNRYNAYLNGNYEINDWIGVFAQANFTDVRARTVQQPSPSVNGWSAQVPGSHPVPAELRAILDSRAEPDEPWQLTYYLDYANREARTDVTTYNILAGLEGEIPGSDWTWEAFVSRGKSTTLSLLTGTASLERLRAVIAAPNWGAGFSAQGNPNFGGFGAASATCTSGLDPFDLDMVISQDCIDAISADLQNRATMQQTVAELNFQGGLLELPAGTVQVALGASYRENNYEFINDTITSQGRSFLDQTVGIYPSGSSSGEIKVKELYGELLIPVVQDLPFVENFEINLGARTSDYNTTGNSFTWKVQGDWDVNDWLRIRGGYNKAERAANVAELFLAPEQQFTAAGGGDVCRLNNTLPYSSNPAVNSNAANVLAICRTLMDQSIAGTADVFYSNPQFYNALGPAFAFPTTVGNPDVKSETAKTITFGAVIQSPSDNPALSRLRLSLDYYIIKINDAIGPLTLDTAQRFCFDPTFNPLAATDPTAAAATDACQRIGRVAGDGALGNVAVTFLNNGRIRTRGLEAQLDWAIEAGPGDFTLNSVLNYLFTYKAAELPAEAGAAGALIEYAGTLGPAGSNGIAVNGLNPGALRWKLLTNLGYSIGPASVGISWQHLPASKSFLYPFDNNTPFVGNPSYDLFGLNATYALLDNVTLRAGIENLFDKAPPLTEYNASATGLANSIGGNPLAAPFFDGLGRRFFGGVNVKF